MDETLIGGRYRVVERTGADDRCARYTARDVWTGELMSIVVPIAPLERGSAEEAWFRALAPRIEASYDERAGVIVAPLDDPAAAPVQAVRYEARPTDRGDEPAPAGPNPAFPSVAPIGGRPVRRTTMVSRLPARGATDPTLNVREGAPRPPATEPTPAPRATEPARRPQAVPARTTPARGAAPDRATGGRPSAPAGRSSTTAGRRPVTQARPFSRDAAAASSSAGLAARIAVSDAPRSADEPVAAHDLPGREPASATGGRPPRRSRGSRASAVVAVVGAMGVIVAAAAALAIGLGGNGGSPIPSGIAAATPDGASTAAVIAATSAPTVKPRPIAQGARSRAAAAPSAAPSPTAEPVVAARRFAPAVVGLTVDRATNEAEAIGMPVEIVDRTSETVTAGIVIAQDPLGGTEVQGADLLTLTVSSGPLATPTPEPTEAPTPAPTPRLTPALTPSTTARPAVTPTVAPVPLPTAPAAVTVAPAPTAAPTARPAATARPTAAPAAVPTPVAITRPAPEPTTATWAIAPRTTAAPTLPPAPQATAVPTPAPTRKPKPVPTPAPAYTGPMTGTGRIEGVVHLDRNDDGDAIDAGDGAIVGATVTLSGCGPTRTMRTWYSGIFRFRDVAKGVCFLTVEWKGVRYAGARLELAGRPKVERMPMRLLMTPGRWLGMTIRMVPAD